MRIRKAAPKPYAVTDLHEALRTALDYVDAVRAALEAQEAGMKKIEKVQSGDDPIFVRRSCTLGVRGPTLVRKGCELGLESRPVRARKKTASRG